MPRQARTHVLRLPPAAGQRPLHAGVQRARRRERADRGRAPDPACSIPRRPAATSDQHRQDRGHRAELLAQDRGLGLRHLAPARADQRARGGRASPTGRTSSPRRPRSSRPRWCSTTRKRDLAVLVRARPAGRGRCSFASRPATGPTRSSPATRSTSRSPPARPGSAACRTPPARTSTRPRRSTGRSTRSGRWSSRATPAGRCCRPAARVYGVVFAAAVAVKRHRLRADRATRSPRDVRGGQDRHQPVSTEGMRLT